MKRTIAVLAASLLFLLPSVSFASTLTQSQVTAIIALLRAFNADPAIIANVETKLGAIAPETSIDPNQLAPQANNVPQATLLAPQGNQDQIAQLEAQESQISQKAADCLNSLPPAIENQLARTALQTEAGVVQCNIFNEEVEEIQTQIKALSTATAVATPVSGDIIQPVEQSIQLTANFEKGSDIDAMSNSDAKYPQILYFDVSLASQNYSLDQLQFSVVMPLGVTTTGVTKWPGGNGGNSAPYTSTAAFAVRASIPGTYPIIITATDPDGTIVTQTLTVTAH